LLPPRTAITNIKIEKEFLSFRLHARRQAGEYVSIRTRTHSKLIAPGPSLPYTTDTEQIHFLCALKRHFSLDSHQLGDDTCIDCMLRLSLKVLKCFQMGENMLTPSETVI
jgi:hypothetical protein